MSEKEPSRNKKNFKQKRALSREDLSKVADMWDKFCIQGAAFDIVAEIQYPLYAPEGEVLIIGTTKDKGSVQGKLEL